MNKKWCVVGAVGAVFATAGAALIGERALAFGLAAAAVAFIVGYFSL